MIKIKRRTWPDKALDDAKNLHPTLKRIYAARGIMHESELDRKSVV